MLSQLKRSIPDLRLHKTHQPLVGKSHHHHWYKCAVYTIQGV